MKNGLKFENKTKLSDLLDKHPSFNVDVNKVYFDNDEVGLIVSQNKLYIWKVYLKNKRFRIND